jgi:hypothetical protein
MLMSKAFASTYLMTYEMLYRKDIGQIDRTNSEFIDRMMEAMVQQYKGKSYYQDGSVYLRMADTALKEQ